MPPVDWGSSTAVGLIRRTSPGRWGSEFNPNPINWNPRILASRSHEQGCRKLKICHSRGGGKGGRFLNLVYRGQWEDHSLRLDAIVVTHPPHHSPFYRSGWNMEFPPFHIPVQDDAVPHRGTLVIFVFLFPCSLIVPLNTLTFGSYRLFASPRPSSGLDFPGLKLLGRR